MADEQRPPNLDVDEFFTLDVPDPTPYPDDVPADPMWGSPIVDDSPGIADVGGLEDLYAITADLPPASVSRNPPAESETAPGPQPGSGPADGGAAERLRSAHVAGDLRFSLEPGPGSAAGWSAPPANRPDPPNPLPPAPVVPIALGRRVRGPGQERRASTLMAGLVAATERRWFWGCVAGATTGLAVLGFLAIANLASDPLGTVATDEVLDEGLPAAPAVVEATETSASDTSSSAGAGAAGLDSVETSTTPSSETSVTTTTIRRTTAAQATVRPTTTRASPTTTAATSTTRIRTSTSRITTATTPTTAVSTTPTTGATTTPSTGATTTPTTAVSTTPTTGATTTPTTTSTTGASTTPTTETTTTSAGTASSTAGSSTPTEPSGP